MVRKDFPLLFGCGHLARIHFFWSAYFILRSNFQQTKAGELACLRQVEFYCILFDPIMFLSRRHLPLRRAKRLLEEDNGLQHGSANQVIKGKRSSYRERRRGETRTWILKALPALPVKQLGYIILESLLLLTHACLRAFVAAGISEPPLKDTGMSQ